jgi:Ca2+-binding EF-hand superfamily protein
MDWSETQKHQMGLIFSHNDGDGDGFLVASEMDRMLTDLGVSGKFGHALHHVLARCESGVCLDDVLDFFSVLMSGNIRRFCRYLFQGMDLDGDGCLGAADLVNFAGLMNEHMDHNQARAILREFGYGNSESLGFDGFWEWYRVEHGLSDAEEEDTVDSPFM